MIRKSFRRSGIIAFVLSLMMLAAAVPMFAQAQQGTIPTAEFFNSLSPQQIAGYFTQLKPEQMQGFFAQMDQGALTSVLGKLGDQGIKAVIGQLPPEVVQGFIDNMTPDTYMGFVAGIKDPELLASLGYEDAAARDAYLLDNLDQASPELANVLYGQLLLDTDDSALEAAILKSANVSDAAAFFLGLDDKDQATLLSMLNADELNQLASDLGDLTEYLAGLDPQAVADALDELNAEDAANYLSAIDPQELSSVLADMDSLSQLQGLLETYAAELTDLNIDTTSLETRIAELEQAQTALAEEYSLSYDDIEAAGAEMMAESTQTPEEAAGVESTQEADGTGTNGGDASAESTEAP